MKFIGYSGFHTAICAGAPQIAAMAEKKAFSPSLRLCRRRSGMGIFMKKKNLTYYFESGKEFSPVDFSDKLKELVMNEYKKNGPRPILFLCIGSDRITGDSLGPLVGYKLEEYLLRRTADSQPCCQVLGTLSVPVHALNLKSVWNSVRRQNPPFLTIAIDASVGAASSCGCITLSSQALAPGEGVNRFLPRVGQISVTGIVSDENSKIPFHLQNIRLHTIMQMADCICRGLTTFLSSCSSQLPVPLKVPDFPGRSHPGLSASACASDPCQCGPHKYL